MPLLPSRDSILEPERNTPVTDKPAILVLASTAPRWSGDHEPRFVLDLCSRLNDRFDVTLLSPHAPGALPDEVLDGVRIHRYRYGPESWECLAYQGGMLARLREHHWRVLLLPIFFLAQISATVRLMRRLRPQAIHAHWIIPQGLVAIIARRLAGVRTPILCTSHGADLFSLRAAPFRWLKRAIIRSVDGITVVSQTMADEVGRIAPGTTAAVIPMGTDLAERFTPPTRGHLDSNEILFVGRLVEKKGVFHLLRAFAKLHEHRPSLQLTIAGFGPDESRLKREVATLGIADAVTFLGAIIHTDLPPLYRRAAVTVVPSIVTPDGDQEGFGLVIVEAIGCGCPVIASSLPAIQGNAGNEGGIQLFPPGDEAALAESIESVLDDPGGALAAAALTRERLRKHFGWAHIAQAYADLLARLSHGKY